MSEGVHYDEVKVEYRTDIKGWVGPDKRFWGEDEHMCRWSNSAFVTCKTEGCENHTPTRSYTICNDCKNAKDRNKWENSERRPISKSDSMYWSEDINEYFDDWEWVEEYCHDNNCKPESLLLYHCERAKPPQLDLEEMLSDVTPEDNMVEDVVSDKVIEAAEALNKALKAESINCFIPSEIAVDIATKPLEAD